MHTKVITPFFMVHIYQVYFIKEGTVALVLRDHKCFKFQTISQGYYFGEIELLFEEIRKYSYMAETDCVLLTITKQNFQRIFFDAGPSLEDNYIIVSKMFI